MRGVLPAAFLAVAACVHAPEPPPASEIPIVRHSDGRLVVQAMVDGAGPYPFIIDTGASVTVLDLSLVEELQLASEGYDVTVHGVSSAAIAPAYGTVTILLGAEEITPSWVVGLKLPDLNGARGVLGMDVLSQRVVEIDGGLSMLRLWHAPYEPPRRGPYSRAELYVDAHGLPHVVVRVNDEEALALVDTGLSGMIIDPDFAARAGVPLSNQPVEFVDVLHEPILVARSGRARLRIGQAHWTVARAALVRPAVLDQLETGVRIEAILGASVFANSRLVIDIGERGLYILGGQA